MRAGDKVRSMRQERQSERAGTERFGKEGAVFQSDTRKLLK